MVPNWTPCPYPGILCANARRVLRARRQRPRRRAAEERDELPSPHGIDPGEPDWSTESLPDFGGEVRRRPWGWGCVVGSAFWRPTCPWARRIALHSQCVAYRSNGRPHAGGQRSKQDGDCGGRPLLAGADQAGQRHRGRSSAMSMSCRPSTTFSASKHRGRGEPV
jgi:hypothetical protein